MVISMYQYVGLWQRRRKGLSTEAFIRKSHFDPKLSPSNVRVSGRTGVNVNLEGAVNPTTAAPWPCGDLEICPDQSPESPNKNHTILVYNVNTYAVARIATYTIPP